MRVAGSGPAVTRIRASKIRVQLYQLRTGRGLGDNQTLAHVELPGELVEVAATLAGETPGHEIVAAVTVVYVVNVVSVLVVAVYVFLRLRVTVLRRPGRMVIPGVGQLVHRFRDLRTLDVLVDRVLVRRVVTVQRWR